MHRLPYPLNRPTDGALTHRALRTLVALTLAACAFATCGLLPQYASAEAIHAPENAAGPQGLPDGRVYEQVTPTNKHGNQVLEYEHAAFVAPDGQAVMYGGSGALAEKPSNGSFFPTDVSERTAHGWVTRSALPLPVAGSQSAEEYVNNGAVTTLTVPSADLSHLLFGTFLREPYVGTPDEVGLENNIYLEGPDPFAEPEWVGQSLIDGSPGGLENEGIGNSLLVAGTSPDLKTIYFFYPGRLFPGASELYEYKEGVLSDAGVLPAGETSAGKAHPAAVSGHASAAAYDNQVSADGSRLFFTREDEKGTRELYARVTSPSGSQSTFLVSQSQLAGHLGEPAPDGPTVMPSTEQVPSGSDFHIEETGALSPPSFVFASPDGSHAFFQSTDRLTEAAPGDSSPKTYDFDLDTGALEYVPGMTGSIVTVSNDGSSAIFENTATTPFALERWVAGAAGGAVTQIAQLPAPSHNVCLAALCVGPAYSSVDGSVVVFSTESPIAGFNDGGSHSSRTDVFEGELETGEMFPNIEVFRYDAKSNELSCVSCPPAGVTPSSNAVTSKLDALYNNVEVSAGVEVISPGTAISSDAGQVFFETRDALVPQDTNATTDVYEWEEGKVYLISSGASPKPSYFTGVGESGEDAFFMTAEGIAPGDSDGSYDVYDARIPRPGDRPPPGAVPCTGAVCQGPPSVPQLLGQPASEAFNGAGDLTPGPAAKHASSKSLTRAQKLARALKVCRGQKGKRKRRRCEAQARHRYGAAAAAVHQVRKQAAHRNGRGK